MSLTILIASAFCTWVVYVLAVAFYNVYLHPLKNVPGPKLWVAFPLFRQISAMRGLLDIRMREFHGFYGDTVR
jgi:hypothetical protein